MSEKRLARLDMAANIITTGVEGGIGYWARATSYQWGMQWLNGDVSGSLALPEGRRAHALATLVDAEEGDGKPFDLTPENVRAAMRKIARGDVQAGGWDGKLRQRLTTALADATDEDADFDADDADCIIQVAMLGSVVYG